MQVSDFKVDFRLKKISKAFALEFMECFNEAAKKKEDTLLTFVVVMLKSLLTPNRLILGMLIMYLMVMS